MIFIFDHVHLFFHFSISFPIILFPKHCFNVDSPISNTFSHLKHGASHNLLILDRKNIQCQFVPSIFICVQPNVVTTDNSRAIMLMYYGRLFIKMACYLFEKKNSLQNRQVHRRKNVPCNTFHSKRYILYLLKLSFLKKKKIINDQTFNINSLHFSQYHTREKIELERDKQERKKKKERERKKFRVGETRVWLIQRWLQTIAAYDRMSLHPISFINGLERLAHERSPFESPLEKPTIKCGFKYLHFPQRSHGNSIMRSNVGLRIHE